MEKAIYGLAMQFNVFCLGKDHLTDMLQLELSNYEVTELWDVIPLTLEHDKDKTLGTTENNLSLQMNESGVYFKYVATSPKGMEAYENVRNGSLRKCSVTYLRKSECDPGLEKSVQSLAKIMKWDHDFLVKKHTELLLHEVCLTNNPANPSTFCTTDKDHPLLKGVKWDV